MQDDSVTNTGTTVVEKFYRSKFIRFGIVGVINTIVDYSIFNLLIYWNLAPVAANIISTSVAFLVSYQLNSKHVFHSKRNAKVFMKFVLVTIFGLWVIQTGTLALLMSGQEADTIDPLLLNAYKLVASVLSIIWNFLMYKYVVFKDPNEEN